MVPVLGFRRFQDSGVVLAFFPPIPDGLGGSGAVAVVRVGPRFWCRFRGRFVLQCTKHDTASVK